MKASILIVPFIALLVSCASKPAQSLVPVSPESSGRILPREKAANVRHSEIIKAYPVGRYVEPRKRGVMHEAHTIYRVEATPKWNLTKPTGRVSTSIHTPVQATTSSPSHDELTVELNRQRQATQAVMQSGQTVSEKLAQVTDALQQNRVLAEQNAAMREELRATRLRLEALEQQVSSEPVSTPKTNLKTDDAPW